MGRSLAMRARLEELGMISWQWHYNDASLALLPDHIFRLFMSLFFPFNITVAVLQQKGTTSF